MSPDEIFQLNDHPTPYMISRQIYNPALPAHFSTGSLGLDLALVTGGWPDKGVSVVYGQPYTGKSTLAISAIKGWHSRAPVLYVSLDNSYDPASGRRILGDLAVTVLVSLSLPDINIFRLHEPEQGLVIVDGIKSHAQATEVFRFHQAYPSLAILAVSEERSDQRGGTNGGWLKTAPVRVRLSKSGDLIAAEVTTNKHVYITSQRTEFAVSPWGIDNVRELLDYAIKTGVVYHLGQWMYYGSVLLGQGRIQVLERLRSDSGVLDNLRAEVSAFIPIHVSVPVVLKRPGNPT